VPEKGLRSTIGASIDSGARGGMVRRGKFRHSERMEGTMNSGDIAFRILLGGFKSVANLCGIPPRQVGKENKEFIWEKGRRRFCRGKGCLISLKEGGGKRKQSHTAPADRLVHDSGPSKK